MTNETIEVHLNYLRLAFDSMQTALRAMDAKIDRINDQRVAGESALLAKIEQANQQRAAGDASLSDKLDKANEQRAAGDAALSVKMDRLTEKVLEIQGHQKSMLWVISLATLIASSLSVARTLAWI